MAPAVTSGAGGAELLLEALPCPFARHLNQPEFTNLPHIATGLVFLQGRTEGFCDFGAVGRSLHIDKVNDNETPNIAQA